MPNSMPTRQLSADFVKSAKAAVANATLLTSPAIEDVIHKCSEAPAIGIDTEFVRERTFYPRPGLVQISNGHQVWLLDAVAVENSSSLGELLDSKATTKIDRKSTRLNSSHVAISYAVFCL